MDGGQPSSRDLLRVEQVPDIRPGEMGAGIAVAVFVQGAEVMGILSVLDHHPSLGGEHGAVPGDAGGQDAVEHIHAPQYALHQAVRAADPHQVPGLFLRHIGPDLLQHVVHHRLRLAHAEPPDAVSDKVHVRQGFGAFDPQVLEEGALYDAEEGLILPGVMGLAPLRPPVGPLHVLLRRFPAAGIGGADVEGHGDIGAQGLLDIHGNLRGDELLRSVQMALEGDALLPDLPDAREGKDLESAAVRQDRLMPVHEAVQAAGLLDQLFSGPQMQVIGIGQQNLGADLLHLPAGHGLDAGGGAHRHIDRGLNIPVRGVQHAQPGAALPADVGHFIGKL